MWEEGTELEIKQTKKSKVINTFGLVCGIGIIAMVASKLPGIWFWVCEGLLAFLFVYLIYYMSHLPTITIGKEGISIGKKEFLAWKQINRAYLFRYTTQNTRHRATYTRLMIEYYDEFNVSKETFSDVTDYDYSWHEVEKAISYWSKDLLADSPETTMRKNPILAAFKKEDKHEQNITHIAYILTAAALMVIQLPLLEKIEGSRGFISLIVVLGISFSFSIAMALISIPMMLIQHSFIDKQGVSKMPKEERAALLESAKKNNCSLTNWTMYFWVSLLCAVVCALAATACLY